MNNSTSKGDSVNRLLFATRSSYPAIPIRVFWVKSVGFCLLGNFLGGCNRVTVTESTQTFKPPWFLSYIYHSLQPPLFDLFRKSQSKISDNIRRKMQDINLGLNDEPIALPQAVIAHAVQANRLAIVRTLLNPKRQNMRALINQMPRLWGLNNEVVGRITEPTKFKFVFQNEEALNLVLRRGPWSFSEWMLVTQRWFPNMPEEAMKTILFWVQIRGIPSQFLNREMIDFIGDNLGLVVESEFDATSNLMDFVLVKINWNIDKLLRFQRNFQFSTEENTILKFRYERLRSFCVRCGMLTHEAKDCPLHFDDNDDVSQDDNNGDDKNDEVQEKVVNEIDSVARDLMAVGPSALRNDEASPSLVTDRDLTAENWRYVPSKLMQEESNGFGKRKRQEIESFLRAYDSDVYSNVNTEELYNDLPTLVIHGVTNLDVIPNTMILSEMSACLEDFSGQLPSTCTTPQS